MRIIAAIGSAVLVMEFVLHGLAMFLRMEQGIEPLTKHFGFRPDTWLVLFVGVLDAAATVGLVVGFWRPLAGTLAALYAVAFFGMMLVLRFYRHLGGILPPDFPLFFALAVVVLGIRFAEI